MRQAPARPRLTSSWRSRHLESETPRHMTPSSPKELAPDKGGRRSRATPSKRGRGRGRPSSKQSKAKQTSKSKLCSANLRHRAAALARRQVRRLRPPRIVARERLRRLLVLAVATGPAATSQSLGYERCRPARPTFGWGSQSQLQESVGTLVRRGEVPTRPSGREAVVDEGRPVLEVRRAEWSSSMREMHFGLAWRFDVDPSC